MTTKKPLRAEVYRDDLRKWRWRIVCNANGKTIADSGQGYWRQRDCMHGLHLVTGSASKNLRIVEVTP